MATPAVAMHARGLDADAGLRGRSAGLPPFFAPAARPRPEPDQYTPGTPEFAALVDRLERRAAERHFEDSYATPSSPATPTPCAPHVAATAGAASVTVAATWGDGLAAWLPARALPLLLAPPPQRPPDLAAYHALRTADPGLPQATVAMLGGPVATAAVCTALSCAVVAMCVAVSRRRQAPPQPDLQPAPQPAAPRPKARARKPRARVVTAHDEEMCRTVATPTAAAAMPFPAAAPQAPKAVPKAAPLKATPVAADDAGHPEGWEDVTATVASPTGNGGWVGGDGRTMARLPPRPASPVEPTRAAFDYADDAAPEKSETWHSV